MTHGCAHLLPTARTKKKDPENRAPLALVRKALIKPLAAVCTDVDTGAQECTKETEPQCAHRSPKPNTALATHAWHCKALPSDLATRAMHGEAPSELHQYSISTPSVLHQYSISTPSVLHQYSISTPSVLHQKSISTPSVLHQYSIRNPSVLHQYSISTPSVLHQYSISTPSVLHQKSISTPSVLHQYSISTPSVLHRARRGWTVYRERDDRSICSSGVDRPFPGDTEDGFFGAKSLHSRMLRDGHGCNMVLHWVQDRVLTLGNVTETDSQSFSTEKPILGGENTPTMPAPGEGYRSRRTLYWLTSPETVLVRSCSV